MDTRAFSPAPEAEAGDAGPERWLHSDFQIFTFIMIAVAGLLTGRYALFLFSGEARGDTVSFLMLCIGEAIAIAHLFGIWMTSPFASRSPETAATDRSREELFTGLARFDPERIAVLVPVCGESVEVIRRTVLAARDIAVPHRTFVLDDGGDPAVEALALAAGCGYRRREQRSHGKAGNINRGLEGIPCEFFAIFDSDHVPRPAFLLRTLPHLLTNPRLAFVQTPQHYLNRDGFVSGGSADMQNIFYRYVQAGKNAWNAAFCVGTNVLFRRSAIDEIGGMYERSNSEDIWTTLLLHERGWQSVFLPTPLADGRAPETLGAFFRQQYRWARGGLEILFKKNPLFCNLTVDQKIQYLHTTMYYLAGVAVFIFFTLPLAYAYFGWKPIATGSFAEWGMYFVPYFVALVASLMHLEGKFPSWRSLVMGSSAFHMHLAALFSVLTGTDRAWRATGSAEDVADSVSVVLPHCILLFLSIGALPLALMDGDSLLRIIVAFWLSFNSATLFSVCMNAFPAKIADTENPAPSSVPAAAV